MLNLNSFVALISPLITSFLGLLIRQALTLSKQRWASTIHFTLSAALLPPHNFYYNKSDLWKYSFIFRVGWCVINCKI